MPLASMTRYPLGIGSTDQGLGKRREGMTEGNGLLAGRNGRGPLFRPLLMRMRRLD
jgi:hypothetical protein